MFDLWWALKNLELDKGIVIHCFKEYIRFIAGNIPTRKQFENNMKEKISHPDFLRDTEGLLRPGIIYDPIDAFETIRSELIYQL